MGKIADKLKGIINPDAINENYDDDYVFDGDDNTEYGYDDYGQQGQPQQGGGGYMNQNQPQQRQQHNQGQYQQQQQMMPQNQGGNMAISSQNALDIKVVRPERFDSVRQIAEHLINRRTVILNLESTTKEDARRMIDFLTGVVYTLQGDIQKTSPSTFVLGPNNVNISEDRPMQQRQDKNIYGGNM